MRKTWIVFAANLALLGGSMSAEAGCHRRWLGAEHRRAVTCDPISPQVIPFDPGLPVARDDSYPLRMAPAVLGGPPLIWSAEDATLVPPPYGSYQVFGRTVPIEKVIGRRVLPIETSLPGGIAYNNPASAPGVVDPEVVLMRLPPAPRAAKVGTFYN